MQNVTGIRREIAPVVLPHKHTAWSCVIPTGKTIHDANRNQFWFPCDQQPWSCDDAYASGRNNSSCAGGPALIKGELALRQRRGLPCLCRLDFGSERNK